MSGAAHQRYAGGTPARAVHASNIVQIWSGSLSTWAPRLRTYIEAGPPRLGQLGLHTSSSDHDQELDSLLVGPIPVGVNKFVFEADPPKLNQIPASEILGVTVILLTCSYDGREFVRVGYYVNNEYDSDDLNREPPAKPVIERVRRNILAEKPRVTRFAIKWWVCPSTGLVAVARRLLNVRKGLRGVGAGRVPSGPA